MQDLGLPYIRALLEGSQSAETSDNLRSESSIALYDNLDGRSKLIVVVTPTTADTIRKLAGLPRFAFLPDWCLGGAEFAVIVPRVKRSPHR